MINSGSINLFNVVALTVDLSQDDLWRSQVGTVAVLEGDLLELQSFRY